MNQASQKDLYFNRTRTAFLCTSVLNMPFWALYAILPIILYKDLHATALQVSIFMTLKPLVSLVSIYWSGYVNKRRDRLINNVIWASIIGNLPFFLFPFIENPWFIILFSPFYTMLSRGVIPAWMEILKLNIPNELREKVFSRGISMSYVGGGFLSIWIGYLMDDYYQVWRVLFPLTAFFNICAIFFQSRILIPLDNVKFPEKPPATFSEQLVTPWKNVWQTLRSRPDFFRYQLGFLFGGFGLMVINAVLPVFLVDILNLSYIELNVSFTLCKGLAFAMTSSFWARWLSQTNIFRFSSVVSILACIYPLLLISAQWHISWVFVAYLVYGMMQAGSELSWHLSGPIFSKGEDSSVYTSVNVALIGMRGCVAPLASTALMMATSPVTVLFLGCGLSFIASWIMAAYSRQYVKEEVPQYQ